MSCQKLEIMLIKNVLKTNHSMFGFENYLVEFPTDRWRTERTTYHQIQRLCRGDGRRRIRQEGRQTVDATHSEG